MNNITELKPGDPAPTFTLLDAKNQEVSLTDFRGQKVILYFYPAAGTPGCTKEACDFQDNLSLLNGQDITVIGISPDSPTKLANFAEKYKLNFCLLSDTDKKVAAEYGAYGEKNMYGRKTMGIIRSTFYIDENLQIIFAKYNVKATGHVARIIAGLTK